MGFGLIFRSWPWFLGQVVLFYLLVVTAAYFLQDYLLYPATNLTPEQARNQYARMELAPWPRDLPGHKGYLAEPYGNPVLGTIIVFHGNAGTALDRAYYSRALVPLGYRVILAEYPGYGSRPGKHGERSFVRDGLELVDTVRERFDGPLILIGESLGAGVVAALTFQRPDSIAGVAFITPWDSLARLAQRKFWFLPVGFLIKSKYDNIVNLSTYSGPKAVLLAASDRVIPPTHALSLFESLSEPKQLWKFEEEGHNSWPAGPEEDWWEEMINYLAGAGQGKK